MEDIDLPDRLEPEPPRRQLPWKDLSRIHRGRGGYSAISNRAQPEFQLASGRTVWLKALSQHLTYGGVLCGLPDEWLNQNHVDQLVQDAAEEFHVDGDRVILVPPVILVSTITRARSGEREDAEIDFLPAVTCMGWFESEPLDPAESVSGAAMAWFQDHFGVPEEEALVQAIRKVDWDGSAADLQW